MKTGRTKPKPNKYYYFVLGFVVSASFNVLPIHIKAPCSQSKPSRNVKRRPHCAFTCVFSLRTFGAVAPRRATRIPQIGWDTLVLSTDLPLEFFATILYLISQKGTMCEATYQFLLFHHDHSNPVAHKAN